MRLKGREERKMTTRQRKCVCVYVCVSLCLCEYVFVSEVEVRERDFRASEREREREREGERERERMCTQQTSENVKCFFSCGQTCAHMPPNFSFPADVALSFFEWRRYCKQKFSEKILAYFHKLRKLPLTF